MSQSQCSNCGKEMNSHYCPNCGQMKINRFTWSHIFNIFLKSIEFEKGFLYNLKNLTLRPGKTVHEYIGGKTIYYLNPITYFILIISFLAILEVISKNYTIYGIGFFSETGLEEGNKIKYILSILGFSIGMAVGHQLVFRKDYNLTESWIISLFVSSQLFLVVGIIFFILGFEILSIVISLLYLIWILYDVLNQRILKFLWKSFAMMIVGLIFLFGVFAIYSIGGFGGDSKISSEIRTDTDKRRLINNLVENNDQFISKVNNEKLKGVDNSSKILISGMEGIKESLISLTGGTDSDGRVLGVLDILHVNSFLFDFDGGAIDSVFNQIKRWELELTKYGCSVPSIVMAKNDFQNKNLIEVLNIFNNKQIQVLVVEKDCLLQLLDAELLKP